MLWYLHLYYFVHCLSRDSQPLSNKEKKKDKKGKETFDPNHFSFCNLRRKRSRVLFKPSRVDLANTFILLWDFLSVLPFLSSPSLYLIFFDPFHSPLYENSPFSISYIIFNVTFTSFRTPLSPLLPHFSFPTFKFKCKVVSVDNIVLLLLWVYERKNLFFALPHTF